MPFSKESLFKCDYNSTKGISVSDSTESSGFPFFDFESCFDCSSKQELVNQNLDVSCNTSFAEEIDTLLSSIEDQYPIFKDICADTNFLDSYDESIFEELGLPVPKPDQINCSSLDNEHSVTSPSEVQAPDPDYFAYQESQPISVDLMAISSEEPPIQRIDFKMLSKLNCLETDYADQRTIDFIESFLNSDISMEAPVSVQTKGAIERPVFDTKNFIPAPNSFDRIKGLYNDFKAARGFYSDDDLSDNFVAKAFSYVTETIFSGLGYTSLDSRTNLIPSVKCAEFFHQHIICKTLPASANKNALKIHESSSRAHLAKVLSLSENSLVIIEQIIEDIAAVLKIRICGKRLNKKEVAEYKLTHNGRGPKKETWLSQPVSVRNRLYNVCVVAFKSTFGFNSKIVEFFLKKISTSNTQNVSKARNPMNTLPGSPIKRHRKNVLVRKPKPSVYAGRKNSKKV